MAAPRLFRPKLAAAVVAAVACAWAGVLLLVAWLAPRDVADVAHFRRLVASAAPASPETVSTNNEKKLVFVRGRTSSPEAVSDPFLPEVSTNALLLVRRVETFQWTEKPDEGPAGVRYEGTWSEAFVDSSAFRPGHENPTAFAPECKWRSREFAAGTVCVGAYQIRATERIRELLPPPEPVPDAPVLHLLRDGSPAPEGVPPEIGDLRVSWSAVPHSDFTVVGAQRADKVTPKARRSDSPPKAALVLQDAGPGTEKVFLLAPGRLSPGEAFAPLRRPHSLPDWLLWRAHRFSAAVLSPGSVLLLLRGLLVSVALFSLTVLCSLPLGLGIALARMNRAPALRGAARVYISVMRGTPLMLQMLFVYFGPYYVWGANLKAYPAFVAAVIAFSLNYAAYFAEIYRAGIESIPVGQHEAAKMLGFTKRDAFLRIVLPQVVKRIVPPVTNEVITLVKDTSLAQVIAVVEMFTIAKQLGNAQTSIAPLVAAGVFYYFFNWLVAHGMERIERKLDYYR